MTTVQLQLIVRYQGREIIEEVTESATAVVGSVLYAVLGRHGLLGPEIVWVVSFNGRPLRLEARLADTLAGVEEGQRITLKITGELLSSPEVAAWGGGPVEPDFDLALEEGDAASDEESGSQVVALEDEEAVDEAAETVQRPKKKAAKKKKPAADEESGDEDLGEMLEGGDEEPLEDFAEVEDEEAAAEEEEEAVPARAATDRARVTASHRQEVERQATVRYYNRMNPQRMYPLLVVLSERKLLEVVKKHVEQATSKRFRVGLDSIVEIEPVLPGCDCYPPQEAVQVSNGEARATFYIVPHVLGEVMAPRVVVRQGGQVLAEIPLQIRVVRQSAAVVMGLVALLLPFVSALLKHYHIDFESQLEEGFDAYARVAHLVITSFSPGVLTLGLLGMTCGTYLWFRPRRREVFFDMTPVTVQEQYRLGIETINAGDEEKGTGIIWRLLDSAPDFQPAWLFCAERYAACGNDKDALTCYTKALKLGKASAKVHIRAAAVAGRLGKTERALAILMEAQRLLGPGQASAVMWYNMGCYATRLGRHDEAMRHLWRAVDAGYRKLEQYRNDRDLRPLRRRPDFQALLKNVGA
jgi:hypothetical protein